MTTPLITNLSARVHGRQNDDAETLLHAVTALINGEPSITYVQAADPMDAIAKARRGGHVWQPVTSKGGAS